MLFLPFCVSEYADTVLKCATADLCPSLIPYLTAACARKQACIQCVKAREDE